MKNLYKLIGIIGMILIIGVVTIGCKTTPDETTTGTNLAVPANIKIEIDSTRSPTREIMVITWNEVPNASGYEVHSVSVGCGSANRLINTKDGTAFGLTFTGSTEEIAQRTGPFDVGTTSTLWDSAADPNKGVNGRVEIIGKNKIEITLMPENNVDNTIHASSLRVKVKALGGTSGGIEYSASNYSAEVTKNL